MQSAKLLAISAEASLDRWESGGTSGVEIVRPGQMEAIQCKEDYWTVHSNACVAEVLDSVLFFMHCLPKRSTRSRNGKRDGPGRETGLLPVSRSSDHQPCFWALSYCLPSVSLCFPSPTSAYSSLAPTNNTRWATPHRRVELDQRTHHPLDPHSGNPPSPSEHPRTRRLGAQTVNQLAHVATSAKPSPRTVCTSSSAALEIG